MSVTQTTTTTTTHVEELSDLQRRLLPSASSAPVASATSVRFRRTANVTMARRFSFVWPFISKESVATEPFLKSRCSQLLRQFPAFLSGHQDPSARTVRDLISRVLTQLKAVWLVLAVYLTLLVLMGLSSAVVYTLLLANKPLPLGLWFLVACVAATGAIAGVSFSAGPRQEPRQRKQLQLQPRLVAQ